jgi:tetratricopeptide (TPR) repeat protein
LEKWDILFGRKNLIVSDYNDLSKNNLLIQHHFLSLIDISLEKISTFKISRSKVNNSYKIAALFLKRMINYVIEKEDQILQNKIDIFLQRYSDQKRDEISVKIDDVISRQTFEKLQKKFFHSNQKIYKTYLNKPYEVSDEKQYQHLNPPVLRQVLQQKLHIINELQEKQNQDYIEIKKLILRSAQTKPITYDLKKLIELFECEEIYSMLNKDDFFFSQKKINEMLSHNYKTVQFLRDIASLLYQRKDYDNARNLINRALELNPNGSVILKISQDIDNALREKK